MLSLYRLCLCHCKKNHFTPSVFSLKLMVLSFHTLDTSVSSKGRMQGTIAEQ